MMSRLTLDSFEELFELLPQIMFVTDEGGAMARLSRHWYDYTGHPVGEPLPEDWRHYLHPEDADEMLKAYIAGRVSKKAWTYEYRLRRHDGVYRWHLKHSVPRYNASGEFENWIGFATDINDRKSAEAQIREKHDQAKKLNCVKDEFLATLSHELRTPLNVIKGHAEILASEGAGLSTEDLSRSAQAILRNVDMQMTIVSDLLDVSSVVTGKITFKPEFTNADEIVRSTAEGLHATALEKGVSLNHQPTSSDRRVWADPSRLHQIIFNLITNAVKFTPRGGEISLVSKYEADHWCFQVKDSGIGIEAEFLPHIFERFRQEDSSSSRHFGGLGLGLSIVSNLTELHGGTVSARSEGRGLGSTFELILPALESEIEAEEISRRSQKAQAAHAVSNETQFDFQGVKLLLVEDSSDNRALLTRMLTRKGIEVFQAESAERARELLKELTPDLIVSDIGMPGENGFEFMRRFRADELNDLSGVHTVPAIALTAYVRDEEVQESLRAGFQAHLSKPVSKGELMETIAQLLRED